MMGDETVELLDHEADQWNNQDGLASGKNRSQDPSRRRLEMAEPSGAFVEKITEKVVQATNPKKRLDRATEIRNGGGKARPGRSHERSKSYSGHRFHGEPGASSEIAPVSSLKRKWNHPGGNRREEDGNLSGWLTFPALRLDADLSAALEESEPQNLEEQEKERMLENSCEAESMNSDGGISGLKLRVAHPSPLEENNTSHLNTHESEANVVEVLKAKEREIAKLKLEMNALRAEHQAELQSLAEKLHIQYSNEASRKIRILCQKAKLRAQQESAQIWRKEVEELKSVVSNERSEKAELVKACDDYLKLHGF